MTPAARLRRHPDRALGGIVVVALLMIAIGWGFAVASTRSAEREAQAHAEADAANLALAMEWQLDLQMHWIGAMLPGVAAQWQGGRRGADVGLWPLGPSLLRAISPDVFVLDAQGRVVAASRPAMLGASMAGSRAYAALRMSPGDGLAVFPSIDWRASGSWTIELARRLPAPGGGFAGLVAAAFDPWTLTSLLRQVDLGPRGLIALVGDDGAIRALVSPGEVPAGQDIAGSAMFRASRAQPVGLWTGASAPDGVARIHAFRRLPGQHLTIVVGIDRAVALRAAVGWRHVAWMFAGARSGAILLAAAIASWALLAARRHGGQLAAERDRLHAAKAHAEATAAELRAVLAGMSDGVMLLDADLRLALWNERFAQYSCAPPGALRAGMTLEELIRIAAHAGGLGPLRSEAAIEAAVASRMGELSAPDLGCPQERTRPDGRSFELRRSRLPNGGLVTLYTDITARRHTEAAQAEARRAAAAAAEQKTRFVAFVSHEIRTPLSALLGSLALLEDSALSDPQRVLADTAREAGAALLELLQDVLEMSRMEAGRLELRPVEFAWAPLLSGVAAMFRGQAEARGIAIGLEIEPGLPPLLHADAGRLRQVLMNLLSNALKFARPGPVLLRASAPSGSPRQDRPGLPPGVLRFDVRDSGPRIPEHEAALLFRPFSRLASAHAADAAGTGLGLAICARLVQLMGGEIGVGGSAEGGNEFWLTLPLPPPGVVVARPAVAAALAAPAAAVLLVEDMPANRRVTAALLRQSGQRVEVAASGAQALELVRTRPFDLVFMDLSMPGLDGCDTARLIRALPGAAGRVPIVALTATTAAEDRARSEAAGIDGLLGKPASAATLAATIAAYVGVGRDRPAPLPLPLAAAEGGIGSEVLDAFRLGELRDRLPPAVFGALLHRCLSDSSDSLALLQRGLGALDAGAAAAAAHTLAGLAANYGLASLQRRARQVEAAAAAGDIVAARAAAVDLEAELDRASRQALGFLEGGLRAA